MYTQPDLWHGVASTTEGAPTVMSLKILRHSHFIWYDLIISPSIKCIWNVHEYAECNYANIAKQFKEINLNAKHLKWLQEIIYELI